MSLEVLSESDIRWHDVLAGVPHDVYHLPGYARVCRTHEPHEVRLAVASDGADVLVQPFMLRDLPRGAQGCDVTVPYGYPGPVSSSPEPEVQSRLVLQLLDGFRDMGAVSAFLRCHPFLGIELDALRAHGEVVVHGDQVYIDLEHVAGPIEETFRQGHRYTLSVLRREGFVLRRDEASDFDAFPELYRENMVRLSAEEYYHFPDSYFDAIRADLADSVHMITVVSPEGEVAAMAQMLVCGDLAQYHLSCTDPRFLKLAPSKLSILGMAEWCGGHGVRRLNLGGGVGGREDSLLRFKAGFSKARAPFATARFVLDGDRYEELSASAVAPEGFFPSYRAGL